MRRGQGRISRGISGAIGFATEAYAEHKRSKSATRTSDESEAGPASDAPPTYNPDDDSDTDELDSDDAEEHDETEWMRDEVQDDLEGRQTSAGAAQTTDEFVAAFSARHPPPAYSPTGQRLPCAVIIPQRRPSAKRRGFVRAYAPVLADCGIDEATFMEFHDGFDKAVNKQGVFNVVNVAVALGVVAETAAVAPSVIVHAVAVVVHTGIEAGRRMYITKKNNSYLDHMNETLFRPHGLYALIMKYDPKSSKAYETVDMDANIVHAVSKRADGHGSSFRSASGKTTADLMPEAAPLVFPGLEKATDEQKVSGFKKWREFGHDYKDRRAQASFSGNNPDSALSYQDHPQQKQEWSSRWADPNHPVNQGGIIGVLTGGIVSPGRRRRQRKEQRAAVRGPGLRDRVQERRGGSKQQGGSRLPIRRMLQEGVLYLMIVNMPSEQELSEAAEIVARSKQAGHFS